MSQENVEMVRRRPRRSAEVTSRVGGELRPMPRWTGPAPADWRRASIGGTPRSERSPAVPEAFEDFRVEFVDLVEVEDRVLVAESVAYLHGRDGVPVRREAPG